LAPSDGPGGGAIPFLSPSYWQLLAILGFSKLVCASVSSLPSLSHKPSFILNSEWCLLKVLNLNICKYPVSKIKMAVTEVRLGHVFSGSIIQPPENMNKGQGVVVCNSNHGYFGGDCPRSAWPKAQDPI
jgi:hypothetical protein